MKSEWRLLVATAVSMGIFFAWFTWFSPPPPPPPAAESGNVAPAVAPPSAGTPAPTPPPVAAAPVPSNIPVETVTISTETVEIEFTNDGGVPTAWRLRRFAKDANGGETQPVNMITGTDLQNLEVDLPGLEAIAPRPRRYQIGRRSDTDVSFRWSNDQLELTKTYQWDPDTYRLSLTVELHNRGAAPLQGRVTLPWSAVNTAPPATGFWAMLQPPSDHWQPLYHRAGGVTRLTDPGKLATAVSEEGAVDWIGVESRYFLAALLPQETSSQQQLRVGLRPATSGTTGVGTLQTAVTSGLLTIPSDQSVQQQFHIYVGPKKLADLRAAAPTLDRAIDYGWLGFIAIPILHLLQFFYGIIHNYGVAIILLTIFIKLLLHPVTKASLASMRRMQLIQPQLKALQEKFKDNRERLNQEMMQLFRSNKVNPMAGCLPMLAQIPIYIALYKVLWNAVELYRAPFVGFYRDLSSPDPYFISPVLLAVAFFLQQKLTPNPSGDPTQRKMMMFMTVAFTAFMIFLPSGLILYILINTAFSILQQWLMNRGLGFRDLLRGRIHPKAA